MATTATPTTRRSQAERSASTRQALLDATIACLVEDGYAKTTTSRVAERAGVSRGAHLHHFQTRQALVAAAMEHLAERRGEHLLAAAENLPGGPRAARRGASTCCGRGYASPLYQAALDLWTHARTDPELRERLRRGRAQPRPPDRCSVTRHAVRASSPSVPASSGCSRWPRRRCAASRCSTRCTPAAGATADSGPTAASGSSSCSRLWPARGAGS